MCSTEEDSALLHRSREAELVESGAEVESVVESVVREGGEVIVDGDKREGGEATDGGISAGHGFGEKYSSGDEGLGLRTVEVVWRLDPTTRLVVRSVMIWTTWQGRKVHFS